MSVSLALGRMSTTDKLRALEEIWDDLRGTPKAICSPSWHADVLHAREMRIREGRSHFHDWSEAKARIRKRAK